MFIQRGSVVLSLHLESAEIGTHLIRKAGQAVEQLGIVQEHLVILGIFVDDVVIDFAPALLKQRAALNFDIVALVLDDIVQGAVDAVGDDVDLRAVIDFGVTGALVCLGALGDVIVVGVLIKVPEPVPDIQLGVVLKAPGDVVVEVEPVLAVEEKHANTDQIGGVFMKVGVIQPGKLFKVFLLLANHFLQNIVGLLRPVTVGVDARGFNIVEIFVDKRLADFAQMRFDLMILRFDQRQFIPCNTSLCQVCVLNVVFGFEGVNIHVNLPQKITCPEGGR